MLIFTPYAAIKVALDGELGVAAVLLVGGIVMWYLFIKWGLRLNQEARDFRRWLRAEHHWLSSLGVVTRLGFPALLGVAVLTDFIFFDPDPLAQLIGVLGVLGIASMFSVFISGIGNTIRGQPDSSEPTRARRSLRALIMTREFFSQYREAPRRHTTSHPLTPPPC